MIKHSPSGEEVQAKRNRPRRKLPLFWLFFAVVQVLFIIWIVTGIQATPADDASQVGAGIGVILIIGVWFAIDVVVLLIRLATRSRRRSG